MYIFPGTQSLYHHLRWRHGKLAHTVSDLERGGHVPLGLLSAEPPPRKSPIYHDSERWEKWAGNDKLLVASDAFGHLAVFDRMLVFLGMFMAFRNRLAGWMPDGTCFGPEVMTGKPGHKSALERFGQMLASGREPTAFGGGTPLIVAAQTYVSR
jgi:hypothetical protein